MNRDVQGLLSLKQGSTIISLFLSLGQSKSPYQLKFKKLRVSAFFFFNLQSYSEKNMNINKTEIIWPLSNLSQLALHICKETISNFP